MNETFYTEMFTNSYLNPTTETLWKNRATLFNTAYWNQGTDGDLSRNTAVFDLNFYDQTNGRLFAWYESEFYDIQSAFRDMQFRAMRHHNEYQNRITLTRQRLKDQINSANAKPSRLRAALSYIHARESMATIISSAIKIARKAAKERTQTPRIDFEVAALVKVYHDHHPSKTWYYYAECAGAALTKRGVSYTQLANWSWKPMRKVWRDALQTEQSLADNPLFYLHAPHVSESDPSMLAYTQSVDKAKRGIQTKIKPGRYLAKYYPSMNAEQVKHLAERWSDTGNSKLFFIENDDPDGWQDIYNRGPSSCMQGEYAVRVYAHPKNDLRLAYMTADDEADGEPIARAIVRENDECKVYIRVYPNENVESYSIHQRMRSVLESAGYSRGNLNGAILCMEDREDGGWVMPYLDSGSGGGQCVERHYSRELGDHWIVGDDGYDATNTNGRIHGCTCDECGDLTDEDELTYVECDDIRVCNDCLERYYTYAWGRWFQALYRNNDVIYCETDGEHYVEEHAEYHDVYQCAKSSNWYHIDYLVMCDVGNYEGDYIHCEDAEQDDLTDEYASSGEFTTDEAGVRTFDDYLRTDFLTGDEYHKDTMIVIKVGEFRRSYITWAARWETKAKELYIHPDNLDGAALVSEFVECGGKLFPKGYYGNEITEAFEPSNVEYPDHGDYNMIEDLLADALPEPDEDDEEPTIPYAPVVAQTYEVRA